MYHICVESQALRPELAEQPESRPEWAACLWYTPVAFHTRATNEGVQGQWLTHGPMGKAGAFLRAANNTYAYGSNCLRDDPSGKCATFRGGLYRQLESQTRGKVNESRIATDVDDRRQVVLDSEVITLNDRNNMTAFPLAVALSGMGGEQGYTPLNALGLGSNSTVLSLLHTAGTVPSRSWSYFSGRVGASRDSQFNGSIVLGGYDRATRQGDNLTLPVQFSGECGSGLPIRVTNMTMNYPNGTDHGIFTREEPMLTCLFPDDVAVMSIPLTGVFHNFYDVREGLAISGNSDRSFGTNYYTMLYENEPVAYKGDTSVEIEGKMTIRISNDQLVRPELTIADSGEIQANTSRPILNIDSLQSETGGKTPSFGSGFFSAMTLLVNYDSGKFTIWPGRATYEQDLVPIASDHTTAVCKNTPDPGPSLPEPSATVVKENKGIPSSTLAGIVVGSVVGIALIVSAIVFIRRRKSTSKPDEKVDEIIPPEWKAYGAPAFTKSQSPVQEPQEIGPGTRYSGLPELEAPSRMTR
ncbi:hypothetical protein EJ05DRAFT_516386 [Pseudovirgaria hyperparasitica]|uniref:Peptidase A1 domain-containing protein n=1 Tax=Pseudovirgaria hyperparasitica TaxID=470096 RepID=A0A6A6WL72_9PEZI|nr:uncharacterized protein EJ05DRAFT_516386 [Pseudovirgaria hyperparasitica]KAF2762922.1 hypothetical protein EJ05DRAFT_516386 [Pseudovirgaria hyperparasitica]